MQEEQNLSAQLARLSEAVEKSNSFWRSFWVSVVRGVGVVVGATIISVIVMAVVWKVLKTAGLEDVLQQFGVEVPQNVLE